MALIRFLLPVAAAALLCACSASSMNEAGEKQQLMRAEPASQPVKPDAPKGTETVSRDQAAAVQKVALAVTSVSDPNSKAYKIGPRDVLEVTVFKVPDLSKTVQVSEAGTISYPLAGEVQAGGRTAREVEQELTKLLGAKYLQNPQIGVFVKEYNSQRFTVEGPVKKPGVYPVTGGLTVLQGIATAGGLENTADDTVLLVRRVNGVASAGKFDLNAIRGGEQEDPLLEPGDVVVVSTSNVKQGMETLIRLAPLASIAPLL